MRKKITGGLPLLLILVLGAGLRVYDLGTESLWVDEGATVYRARMSVGDMVASTAVDKHPPLYLGAMHYWIKAAGDSEAGLRSFSAVFGALTILMLYRIAAMLLNREAALLAALLAAVSPHLIHWSQEARCYSFMGFFGLVSVYLYLHLYDRDRTGDRVALGVVNAALLYTHNYALFFILAQNIHYGLVYLLDPDQTKPRVRAWVLCQVITVILFLPWAPTLLAQTIETQRGYWITRPTLGTLTGTFIAFAGGPGLALIMAGLGLVGIFSLEPGTGTINPRRLLSDLEQKRWALALYRPRAMALLGVWLTVTLLAPFFASLVSTPIYHPRPAFLSAFPFYLLAAAGLARVRPRALQAVILAALLVLAGSGLTRYYTATDREQWREAIRDLDARAWAGDRVLVYPPYAMTNAYVYYSTRPDLDAEPVSGELAGAPGLDLEAMSALLGGRRSVWLLCRRVPVVPRFRVEELARIGYRVAERKDYLAVEVFRLEKTDVAPGPPRRYNKSAPAEPPGSPTP